MNLDDTVSIIIPAYDCAQWVCEAVDCCMNQSHRNCEIIVVDDGSHDNTRAVLAARYGDKIRYIYQENQGVAKARNTGLLHASGRYVQFLDADDLILPEKLSIQLERMRRMTSPSVTYTDYYHCDIEDTTRTFPKRYVSPEITSDDCLSCIAADWEMRLSIPIHSFLFDAAFFRQYGLKFDESLVNNEDWDCWMQIFALRPDVEFIPQKLALYRVRSNSTCHNLQKMRDGCIQAIRKQKKAFADNLEMSILLDKREKEIRYRYRNYNSLNKLLQLLPDRYRKTTLRMIPWRIQRMFD